MTGSHLVRAMVIGQSLLIAGVAFIAFGLILRSTPGARVWLVLPLAIGIATAGFGSRRLPIWAASLCGTLASAGSILMLDASVPAIDLAAGLAGAPAHGIIGAWLAWARRTAASGATA